MVKRCPTCIKQHVNAAEPAIPSELADRPWQKLAADLFELKNQQYLLVIDYFSRYVEVAKLSRTTSPNIIVHLKSMFARHSIPDQLPSDNGPQFSANTNKSSRTFTIIADFGLFICFSLSYKTVLVICRS